MHPSDAVVSRVSRELSKRMLCVFSAWKVRSLQFQIGSSQRKRKLGEGLFTDAAETEEVVSHDCDTYLQKLHTLMIVYALAGVAPLLGGDPTKEFVLGANSTEFIEEAVVKELQVISQFLAGPAISGKPTAQRMKTAPSSVEDSRPVSARTRPHALKGPIAVQSFFAGSEMPAGRLGV